MTLAVMKYAGPCHALGYIFQVKNPVLICLISGFTQKLSVFVDRRSVTF